MTGFGITQERLLRACMWGYFQRGLTGERKSTLKVGRSIPCSEVLGWLNKREKRQHRSVRIHLFLLLDLCMEHDRILPLLMPHLPSCDELYPRTETPSFQGKPLLPQGGSVSPLRESTGFAFHVKTLLRTRVSENHMCPQFLSFCVFRSTSVNHGLYLVQPLFWFRH